MKTTTYFATAYLLAAFLLGSDAKAQENPPAKASGRSGLLAALMLRYGRSQGDATIQQDGLLAGNKANLIYVENKVVNGQLQPPGRSSQMVPSVALTAGQAVYVTKVDAKGDLLRLHVLTVESYDYGHTEPFKMVLSFKFSKNYLDTATLEDVEGIIDPFLSPPGLQPSGNAAAETEVIPPPQQPANAYSQPPRITLGQTIDEIVSVLGAPEQIIDLGPKQIYRYKDLKVTFVNHRVSDVQ